MGRDHQEQRAWVRMPSGRRLDLLDPTPFDWDDSDLALGLARTYRWGGHSAWPLPLSVAQHSLLVLELRQAAAPAPLSAEEALQEILHDAEEGFLGFDCISPLKAVLGEPFRAVADRLMQVLTLARQLRFVDAHTTIGVIHERISRALRQVHDCPHAGAIRVGVAQVKGLKEAAQHIRRNLLQGQWPPFKIC